jgi:hypothetical protein
MHTNRFCPPPSAAHESSLNQAIYEQTRFTQLHDPCGRKCGILPQAAIEQTLAE